jgi:hypothetical protein
VSPFAWTTPPADDWFEEPLAVAELLDGSRLYVEDNGPQYGYMMSWCPPGEHGRDVPRYAFGGEASEGRDLEEAKRAAEAWHLRGLAPRNWPLGDWRADPLDLLTSVTITVKVVNAL